MKFYMKSILKLSGLLNLLRKTDWNFFHVIAARNKSFTKLATLDCFGCLNTKIIAQRRNTEKSQITSSTQSWNEFLKNLSQDLKVLFEFVILHFFHRSLSGSELYKARIFQKFQRSLNFKLSLKIQAFNLRRWRCSNLVCGNIRKPSKSVKKAFLKISHILIFCQFCFNQIRSACKL